MAIPPQFKKKTAPSGAKVDPKSLEDCVLKRKSEGMPKPKAFAICNSSLAKKKSNK